MCQTTFLLGKVLFSFFSFLFFLVSRDAESQRVSSISCFLNFVIDFAFFCVWKRGMRTVTRTASNFLFDVLFFYLSRDVKCCMIRNYKYRCKVFRRINGILNRQDDRIECFN